VFRVKKEEASAGSFGFRSSFYAHGS